MATDEERATFHREEARRERYERTTGWTCATCWEPVDDDRAVYCEGRDCVDVMHPACALSTPEGEEASAYLCQKCATLTADEIERINARLVADSYGLQSILLAGLGHGPTLDALEPEIEEGHVALPPMNPYLLLDAIGALGVREVLQCGGSLKFVYGLFVCDIRDGLLRVQGSQVSAELIASLIARHVEAAEREKREGVGR